MDLRTGLTSRPLVLDDAPAVTAVIAEQEQHDLGVVEIELADIVGDWQLPSFDVPDSTIGVFDGDVLVGYAEFSGGDRGDAAVRPAYRGRGIGTALARWMQDRARAKGATVVGMPVPEGSPADRLLAALGYRVRWTSWILKLPPGAAIVTRPLPEGYAIRAAASADYPAVHTVVEDAFLEWAQRDRLTYEDFIAAIVGRPGFEPWNLRVVVDPTGEVVGAAHVVIAETEPDTDVEAFVYRLAVRRDLRGQGLAQALLVDAFAEARARGAVVSGLSTDSRTGALGLYEKVGMKPTSVWLNRAIDL